MNYSEYLSFIKKYCGLLNNISDLMGDKYYMYDDNWKNLSLSELQEYNYKLFEPLKKSFAVLTDNSDELHRNMSIVAYWILTRYQYYVFERNFKQIASFKSFLYRFTKAIENNEDTSQVIYDYIHSNIKDRIDCDMKFIYTSYLLNDIILNCDLDSYNYLYLIGSYISDNELKIVDFFNNISNDKIKSMANTVVEGFLRGYKNQNLDFNDKDFVIVYYPLGFEKMAKEIYFLLKDKTDVVFSVITPECNKQLNYFHKNDSFLYVDERYVDEVLKAYDMAFEKYKNMLSGYGGPIWVESFGEKQFEPENKFLFNNDPLKDELIKKIDNKYYQLFSDYSNSKERSFSIISYPCPDIGDDFEAIFEDTIELNTLDNDLYDKIQEKIIDVLDKGDYVHVKGCNGNSTDIKVNLIELSNPEKETLFENCTADVNIPVGEVFTTPKLSGTDGVLNVSQVYLNGLKYKNLTITFKDGRIVDYNCDNFESEEENKQFIKENILFNNKTLPIGEFAIGTNTKAYLMAKKYHIESKLDILIAEKTGPHFAVGDTCYSHQEDLSTYNSNGKEIMPKENDYSVLRTTDIDNAYFGCHTDITIPFEELEFINVVTKDGETISIIENGKFVVEDTDFLNEPLEKINNI